MSPGTHIGSGLPHDPGARPPTAEEIRAAARGRQEHLPYGHKVRPPGQPVSSADPVEVPLAGGRIPEFPETPEEAAPRIVRGPGSPQAQLEAARKRAQAARAAATRPAAQAPSGASLRPAWTKTVKATPVERPENSAPNVPRPFLAGPPPPRASKPRAAPKPMKALHRPAAKSKKAKPMAGHDDAALEKRFGKLEL